MKYWRLFGLIVIFAKSAPSHDPPLDPRPSGGLQPSANLAVAGAAMFHQLPAKQPAFPTPPRLPAGFLAASAARIAKSPQACIAARDSSALSGAV